MNRVAGADWIQVMTKMTPTEYFSSSNTEGFGVDGSVKGSW
jgi:hypothetical protein